MNSFRNGGWEDEESVPDNPFNVGQAFEIFIVIKPEGYQVYVNDKEHYLFKHRIPLEKVSVINIEGHVAVNLFAFIQNWEKSSFAKHLNVFLQSASSNIISELSLPVKNPTLPYVGPISGGLRPGMAMYLQGVVGSETDPFAVNLKTGQSDKDDIAFHFHFQNNVKAVMNSFRGGKWEAEEFASVPPFKMGELLELLIVIKLEGYQVFVNGYETCLFRHRIPVEKVSALNIVGNVVVNLCGFIQNWSKSSFAVKGMQILNVGSLQCELPSIQSDLLLPVHSPTIPYMGPIRGGVKAGMSLFMHGIVASNADWFSINFLSGQSDKDDIAFQLKPQLNSKVVMNTRRNGEWEAEEYASINPFKKGEAFELLIFFTPHGYQVHVKGQELCMYKHRMPLDKVTALFIDGGVSVGIFSFMMGMEVSFMSPPTVQYTHHGMGGGLISPPTVHHTRMEGGFISLPTVRHTHHGMGGGLISSSTVHHTRMEGGFISPPTVHHTRLEGGLISLPTVQHTHHSMEGGLISSSTVHHTRMEGGLISPPTVHHTRMEGGFISLPTVQHTHHSMEGGHIPPSTGHRHHHGMEGGHIPPSTGHRHHHGMEGGRVPHSTGHRHPHGMEGGRIPPPTAHHPHHGKGGGCIPPPHGHKKC
ncbi:uncharacterized protein [Paramisgurnus dabryanus]|uniref:uncharacterized protein n=1 Tax=Paramisgurnus dabryanus TaxID=90735 RepID=UPI0031F337C0